METDTTAPTAHRNTIGPDERAVLEWLANGDVGESSEQMAFWLGFAVKKQYSSATPQDPDDFDRCLGLLHQVPHLRALLPLMAQVSPSWAALVARWDELESTQLAEIGLGWSKARSAPISLKLIREILDSAQVESKADRGPRRNHPRGLV